VEPGELRKIKLLADLSDEWLEELAQHGRELELAPGEYLFREDENAEFLSLLLGGRLETVRTVGGDELPLLYHEAGGFLGAISLVTDESYRGTTRAIEPSRLFLLEPEAFRKLLVSEPTVFKAVMEVFIPVISNLIAMERDRDRLLALGSLSAGLAHELNNPAAAAQRAASDLQDAEASAQSALSQLAAHGMAADAMGRLCALTAEALDASAEDLDSLERSDREGRLASWLVQHGVNNGYGAASAFVDAGLDEAWLQRLLDVAPADGDVVVGWVASRITAARTARELADATARISALVNAVREYSNLDRTQMQELDVHEGIESTLVILQHKIAERRVTVEREFDRSLPRIDAHALELNQIWTNLIDNAVAATGEGGTVTVRTLREGGFLVVEVEDDGAGVPDDIHERILDPFFTTKPPGEGTGLGLDIVRRIVLRHHGDIRLKPVARGACFQVLLPLPA
jgi:signal transduction histidine kinase